MTSNATKLSNIEMDATIQCRANIDLGTVNEYAERMEEGDTFPPVVLFGDESRCWIGDGWHRVMAAESVGFDEILADVRPGNRAEALKHALGANAVHGRRRTNADKRRCVEVALGEWPHLSSRMISEMCGVDHKTVEAYRPSGGEIPHVERTGQDGKQYPATRQPRDDATDDIDAEEYSGGEEDRPLAKPLPPQNGMQFARMAIMDLEQIRKDDVERQEAFDFVKNWIRENEAGTVEGKA